MKIFQQIFICFALSSCANEPTNGDPADVGDDADTKTTNIVCEQLDKVGCEGDDKCVEIMGQSFDTAKNCFGAIEFVTCVDAEDGECTNNGIIGFFERNDTCWYQSGRCAPASWYEADSACGAENLVFCSDL